MIAFQYSSVELPKSIGGVDRYLFLLGLEHGGHLVLGVVLGLALIAGLGARRGRGLSCTSTEPSTLKFIILAGPLMPMATHQSMYPG